MSNVEVAATGRNKTNLISMNAHAKSTLDREDGGGDPFAGKPLEKFNLICFSGLWFFSTYCFLQPLCSSSSRSHFNIGLEGAGDGTNRTIAKQVFRRIVATVSS